LSNRYHFITKWRVEGTVDEVLEIMDDATQLPQWWPSVYLKVDRIKEGGDLRLGEEIALFTKGFLPYTLLWNFTIVEVIRGKKLVLKAVGDFVGTGTWLFSQDGQFVDITYEWDIRAEKPLLKRLTFILRPIFAANHRWAMEMGEKSLKLELARRRAATPEERAKIAPPPGATFRV
jgi:hypothetical protein